MIELLLNNSGGVMFEYSELQGINRGSGIIQPPLGAKGMRLAAIGSGSRGGGGGGCAATKIIRASEINYSVASNNINDPADTVAEFSGRVITGQGGIGGIGGIGVGGDYNYKGGDYVYQSGGAAGPMGDGGSLGSPLPELGPGWGVGGGAGGRNSNGPYGAGPGADAASGQTSTGGTVWGRASSSGSPGAPGGGGGSTGGTETRARGALVIEWFF